MSRKNPFRVIRKVATWVASIALAALLLVAMAGLVVRVVDEVGADALWQIPLAICIVFAVAVSAFGVGQLIAELWRMAENGWERKNR